MHTWRFSLQTMRAAGRRRRLLWPLLGILVLMLQPLQACCTLVDVISHNGSAHGDDTHAGTANHASNTSDHHPDPESHCASERPQGCLLAVSFRISAGPDDVAPDPSTLPRTSCVDRTPASPSPPIDRVPPVHPPPWLLTRRLRI
ncbi:MAG: hypothetical protein ACE5FQ_13130 [Thiogranum sp.]